MTRTVERRRSRESAGRGWEKSVFGSAEVEKQTVWQETVGVKAAAANSTLPALASITRARISQIDPVVKHATWSA